MKKFLSSLMLLAFFAVVPASAQNIDFGLKGGVNVSSMSFGEDAIDKIAKDRIGWFVGPSLKISLPLLPLGFDIAAFYDQKEAEIADETVKQQSVLIPINVRANIGLGSMAAVYLAAGPQFGFNVGKDEFEWTRNGVKEEFQLKKSAFSVNLGAGLTLIDHLEIGFTYNIPVGDTGNLSWKDAVNAVKDDNKMSTWTVSAAYYF